MLIPLLFLLTFANTASAKLLFSLRGDSLIPRYAMGGKGSYPYVATVNLANIPVVINNAAAGVFGGKVIDVRAQNGDTRFQTYPSYKNWVTETNVFSFLYRFVPQYTGIPANDTTIFSMSSGNGVYFPGGIKIMHYNNGRIVVVGQDDTDSSVNVFSGFTAGAVSFTSGVPTEIMIVSDGVNLYVSQDGVEIINVALTNPTKHFNNQISGRMNIGTSLMLSSIEVNEMLIWDDVQPHVYAPRIDFFPCADYDGILSTDPGIANVRSLVSYYINGIQLQGTSSIPLPSQVLLGNPVDATVGTVTEPSAADVRLGTAFGDALSLIGSLNVPSVNDVRLGVAVDASVGNITMPGIGAVLFPVTFDSNNSLQGTAPVPVNIFNSAKLLSHGPYNDVPSDLTFTQGDDVTAELFAENGDGTPFDLTSAHFSTSILGSDGVSIVMSDAQHIIVSASHGEYRLSIPSSQTSQMMYGENKDIVTKIISAAKTIFFRGRILTIFQSEPQQ